MPKSGIIPAMAAAASLIFVVNAALGQNSQPPPANAPLPFVSPIFGDNMVLQRGKPDTIWGWSKPGDTVRVQIGDRSATGTAGADRRWEVKIEPPAPGGPYTVTITGAQTVEYQNVLVGDVWLCGGQSNMELPLRATANAEEVAKTANDPEIRCLIGRSTAHGTAVTTSGRQRGDRPWSAAFWRIQSTPIDVSKIVANQSGTTGTDNLTTNTATSTTNGDLIFGAIDLTDSSSPTPGLAVGSGETRRQSTNPDMLSEDKQQLAAGAVASTATIATGTATYHAAEVAIKPAATGGGGGPGSVTWWSRPANSTGWSSPPPNPGRRR